MAQTQKKRPRKSTKKPRPEPKAEGAVDPSEGESAAVYAKQAVSQWGTAVKLGAAAVTPAVKRLGSLGSGSGSLKGKAADWALSHSGTPGRVASKLGLGSKLVSANGSGGEASSDEEPETNGEEAVSVPIQEAITVAVPIGLAYRLATRFEDYPQFLDHAHDVTVASDSEVDFDARLHGTPTRIAIEIVDRRENERIDWRGTEGPEHSGTASFHELAPRLTRIELSVDLEPHGVVQRVSRAIRLSNHAVKTEMQRFKAFAELYEDEGDADFEDEDEPVAEEPIDEEELDEDEEIEEPVDEEEPVDQEELDEDEELEDEPIDEEELDEDEFDEGEEDVDEEELEDEELEDEEVLDEEEPLEEERAA